MSDDLQALHTKLDYLTEQIEEQRRRQQVIDDLIHDMTPVANGMFQIAIDELDEIGNDVELTDVMYLLKRVLRDVRLLNGMLEQLESLVELANDLGRLSQPTFVQAVNKLDELERKGYFTFATQGASMLDRIVTEFDQADVQALGDNVVTILKTVRNMTQPEVMALVNNAVAGLETPVNEDISTWQLLREMRDPEVRKGMARLLHMVKGFAYADEALNMERKDGQLS